MVTNMGFIFFMLFVLNPMSLMYALSGLLVFSLSVSGLLMSQGNIFFSLIFMLVYSSSVLLLLVYFCSMLSDYEVKRTKAMNFFFFFFFMLSSFHFFFLSDFNNIFIFFLHSATYLSFCLLVLSLSLVSMLYLLLKISENSLLKT